MVIRLLSFVLIIMLSPVTGVCDSLTIPIEWYYGRWPSGHAAEVHFPVSSDKIQLDDGWSAYTYSNGSIRVGVNRFQDLLLISDDANNRETADFTFGYRPSRNWQISLNSLTYLSRTSEFIAPPPSIYIITNNTKRFSANLSLDWSNKSDVSVSPSWQRYMEFVGSTVGQGQWSSNLSLSTNLSSSNRTTTRLDSTRITSSSTSGSDNRWSFRNSLKGAISDKWHLSFDVRNFISKSSTSRVEIDARDGIRSIRNLHSESINFQPNYRLRNIFKPTNEVFIEISISQQFFSRKSSSESVLTTIDTTIETAQRNFTDRTLQETQTTLGGRVDILSEGSFVSGIVLDDYAGYYHKMLFRSQYHGQFEYVFSRSGFAGTTNTNHITLRHSSRYGLSSKINIGGLIAYEWANSGRGSSRLNSRVDISWRSYEYEPGSGPGWFSDSPLDVQYGPIKRPGHLFASLSVSPPRWGNIGPSGFLSFSNLVSNKTWSVSSALVAGLPWQSEVRATNSLTVLPERSDIHVLRLSIAKRMLNKLEFSIDYAKDRPSRLAQQAGLADDFEITFNFRGLL